MDQLEELHPIKFAQVPNEAVDTLPDLNSVGLLTTMLRHAPGFGFTVGDVIERKSKIPGPKLGKAAAYGAMTVLIEHGWAARVKYRCAGGHFHTSIFRTAQRFTLADLRRIAQMFTEGTEKIIHCKGCSEDPEIPVRTRIRAGATIQSLATKAEYAPITDLLDDPGSDSPGSASPASGKTETGATCENTPSPQVAPASGNRETGAREARNAETFNKTEGEHESSSSSGTTPDSGPSGEPAREDEEDPRPENIDRQPEPSVLGIVTGATDATAEEAQALVEVLRPEATKSLTGYIRKLAATGDLEHRLWRLRREQRDAEAARVPSQRAVQCDAHPGRTAPCPMCRIEVRDPDSHERLWRALREQGEQARPDLAELLAAHAPAGA